jgi:DNA-binding SARP family transcriptional activator
MGQQRVTGTPVVEGRYVLPTVSDRLLTRPRLDAALRGLLDEHRIVGVWATAGAGKTTTVRQALEGLDEPVAWLTLDPADAAPGHLLVYLEAALRTALPGTERAASAALATGVLHPEAAGILAQALPRRPAVLVLDELERIAGSRAALDVVASLLRYLDPLVRVMLIGRVEVELEGVSRLGYGAVGRLGEDQLAFDATEAEGALALHGLRAADPRSVVEATGGWVTGVLFEAWRSREHVGGSGGEADPLAGYLAAEILDGLDDAERDFLVETSLFGEVDARRAASIGVPDAAATLAGIARRHLPVTWREGGTVLRCHPRFREYLRSLLDRRDPARTRELRRRHGQALAADHRYEEAVAELLAAGWAADAVEPAGPALRAAIGRLDLDLAQAWLDGFAAAGLVETPVLLSAQLSVSIAREEFGRAVEAADALRALDSLTGTDPSGIEHRVLAAWGLWHVGRVEETRSLLADAPPGHGGDVMRYLCSLLDDEPPAAVPQLAGGPLDALILRISFVRGRLAEVRDAPVSAWTPAATERASALRALGDLERTRHMLESGASRLPNIRFEATVGPELLIDLGHEDLAREALLRGRARIVSSGSLVFEVVSRILAAKLELRVRRNPGTALTILRGVEAAGLGRRYGYLAEQIDMWLGGALLHLGRDEEARGPLEAAVASMRRADRVLELPTAAVFLAEARWRAGAAEEADRSADLALEAALRQGSKHLLLQALEDFPGVLGRRLDAEESVDGAWHDLARSPAAGISTRRRPLHVALHLRDLGPPALVVAGEVRRARLAKSYALLAYLVHAGGRATRRELIDGLFDGRADDSTMAYLRQAAQGLRQLLPERMGLLREGAAFVLDGCALVETDMMLLEARLRSASAQVGPGRVEATHAIVTEHAQATYLDGVDCAWVEERRRDLASLLTDARIETAVAALDESRFEIARSMLTEVLADEPHREQAWRLLMRVSAARGREDQVVELYRRCESALGALGLEPARATRLLVDGLRR